MTTLTMLQADTSAAARPPRTPTSKEEELVLNTTCETASISSHSEEEEEEDQLPTTTTQEEDVVAPLPNINAAKNNRRSSDLKVATQTRDVRYILHKMRERRPDVQLQIWAVEALQKCHEEDIEDAEELVKNVIRSTKRHPYSNELQVKAIVALSHLGKASQRVKECLTTPDAMEMLFSAVQQQQQTQQQQQEALEEDNDQEEGENQSSMEEQTQQPAQQKAQALEVYTAVFSLFAVGFDQFDHSMLIDEGAIAAITEVLQELGDDDNDQSPKVETIFEWGTLALGELSWLCEDMTVPQVFPNLQEVIELAVAAMNHYPLNSSIQNSCGEILRHIMKNDDESAVMVKEAGGATALCTALHTHLDQEDVLVEGCLTLTHFLPFPDLRDQCFTTVLTTMAQHVDNVDVQLGGCAFLADAAENTSNTFRFLFDTTQAIPLLMTAMELNPENDRLQEHGCRALQTVGAWLKGKSERKKTKIMGLVVGAMRKHKNAYWLQQYACQALQAMVSSWGTEATTYMVKVGGIRCLQGTMEHYMEDAEMLWPGLAIVSRLDLMGNKFARDAVMKGQCLRTLMDGIKLHGGHDRVQEFGDLVIDLLNNVNMESSNRVDLDNTGDCCMRCLKLSLARESSERWQGCSCAR